MKFLASVIVILALSSLAAAGPEDLDPGHRLLIKWGLQIQAQVFHSPTNSFDLKRWKDSNFTTVNFHAGEYPSAPGHSSNPTYIKLLGPPPAIPWARWVMSSEQVHLTPHELPYLPNMVSLLYFDEKDIRDSQFQQSMAKAVQRWHTEHPDVIVFHNSFGGAFYPKELRQYMQAVKPDMLSIDSYPFRLSHIRKPPSHPIGGSPRVWYEHMQKYRLVALAGHDGTGKRPIPYAQYLDTFTFNHEKRHLTADSEIRLNQFASWTFGFTGVSAFIYNSPDGHGIESALFDGLGDAQPTRAFFHIAETNRQSLNLGPTLVRLQSTDVRIIPGQHMDTTPRRPVDNVMPAGLGPVTAWDRRAGPYITRIVAENIGPLNDGLRGDVLVGYFKPLLESDDGPDHEKEIYFMITNGLTAPSGPATATQQRIRLDFDFAKSGITSLQRRSRQTGLIEVVPLAHHGGSRYHLDLVLDGGTGDLFKFNTGARFVQ